MAGLMCGNLSLYHLYLIVIGRTTHEYLKNEYPDGNPFDRGVWANCIGFWFSSDVKSEWSSSSGSAEMTRLVVGRLSGTTSSGGSLVE